MEWVFIIAAVFLIVTYGLVREAQGRNSASNLNLARFSLCLLIGLCFGSAMKEARYAGRNETAAEYADGVIELVEHEDGTKTWEEIEKEESDG